jgi:hypothetical protein
VKVVFDHVPGDNISSTELINSYAIPPSCNGIIRDSVVIGTSSKIYAIRVVVGNGIIRDIIPMANYVYTPLIVQKNIVGDVVVIAIIYRCTP